MITALVTDLSAISYYDIFAKIKQSMQLAISSLSRDLWSVDTAIERTEFDCSKTTLDLIATDELLCGLTNVGFNLLILFI